MALDSGSQVLIERARGGDRAALEALLVKHLPGLHGFVRLRCGGLLREQESSSDLVQSVCHEVLRDLSNLRYQGEAAFRHWLYRAAERKLVDRARYWARGKRDVARNVALEAGAESDGEYSALATCYGSFASPSQGARFREQVEQIERAWDELPDSYREIITLIRIEGFTTDEAAKQLEHSPAYTRTLLSRALARLSTLLDRA